VWRRGRQTHSGAAYAVSVHRGGYHRPRSPRRDRSRSPSRDRSRSTSPPRAIEATWPTRASSSAAVSLFEPARVRDVRFRAPRGAAVSAVAHACVNQVTGLRRAVERADGRGVESASGQYWAGRGSRRRWRCQLRALCSAPRGCAAGGGGSADALHCSDRSGASCSCGRGAVRRGPALGTRYACA